MPALKLNLDTKLTAPLREGALLAAAVAPALWVRARLFTDRLSHDECQHYLVAISPLWKDFFREVCDRAHPPLAYLAMKLSIQFGSTAPLLRLASLASGIFGIFIAWRMTRRLTRSAPLAALAAFFAGITPVLVLQSLEVRQYGVSLAFVWLSLLIYQEIRAAGNEERFSSHCLLAAVQFGAVMSEYSSLFHLLALSLTLYVPLCVSLIKRGQAARAGLLFLPQALVFLSFIAFFTVHFSGAVPNWRHTGVFMYAGQLDPAGAARYFTAGISAFLSGLLPSPWSWLIAALVLAPPLAFRNERSPVEAMARRLSLYAILFVGSVFCAGLLGKFPYGGYPRHMSAVVPGIFLCCFYGLAGLVGRLGLNRPGNAALAAAVSALFLPGFQRGLRQYYDHKDLLARLPPPQLLERYAGSPGPVAANWRGRNLSSWWLLAGRRARRLEGPRFDYEGTAVFESESPEKIAQAALSYANRSGRAWILLGYLSPEAMETGKRAVMAELAGHTGVDVKVSKEWGMDLEVVAMELTKK